MALTTKQRTTVLDCLERGLSLRKACTEADIQQTATIVLRECDNDPLFAEQYARARQEGYAFLAEDLIESLQDDDTDPARLRIRTDTRKWLLSKYLPKVFGDRVSIDAKVQSDQALSTAELMAIAAKGKAKPSTD